MRGKIQLLDEATSLGLTRDVRELLCTKVLLLLSREADEGLHGWGENDDPTARLSKQTFQVPKGLAKKAQKLVYNPFSLPLLLPPPLGSGRETPPKAEVQRRDSKKTVKHPN